MARAPSAAAAPDLFATPAKPDRTFHIGIGGWVYAPWRGGNFYPEGLVQRRELEFASRQLTAIEINGTYYGAQKPATYAKWRDETPQGFVFSAKAPKRITQARALDKVGAQVEDFVGGIAELGDRLGPLVWQFDAGTRLQRAPFEAFLDLLPARAGGRRLRHVLDVRDADFFDAQLLHMVRQRGMATVFSDSDEYPSFADLSGELVYARLMRARSALPNGYTDADLDRWAKHVRAWADGQDVPALPHLEAPQAKAAPREVFLFFIAADKERNPAAAMALLQRLGLR
ncbi:DUF72 domain-containing protein [Pseudoxanthomonas composti]|uniref:DUF72 domain-containing protein n=1 Tax=Pseudoxanthomonas composti TaxID=2137479 RepID=A0A4Q1JWU1_9GAMM|nr:DUF72 domain-containing protein [Pseudoxanthomonas composti]RXR05373.1 DUF72 domain-containing protein [Pseudoxanthomonas composti]